MRPTYLPCASIESYACRIPEWLKAPNFLQTGVLTLGYDNLSLRVVGRMLG
jgi:hypothetical protein